MFLWIEISELENFADDNTISAFAESIPKLIKLLESESDVEIDWFKQNEMLANAGKWHAIIVNRCVRHKETHTLNIAGKVIQSEKSVPLLGVEIDYKLNFEKHIGNLCKRAAGQLNAMCRINRFIGEKEEKGINSKLCFI